MWFYASPDGQQGPVSPEELGELARSGTVRDNTLVWREGLGDWMPFADVRHEIPGAEAAPASADGEAYTAESTAYSAPQSSAPPTNFNGPDPNTWFVISIITTVMGVLCCPIFFIAIAGIVMSSQAKSHLTTGNLEEAAIQAQGAKKWTMIAIITGVISFTLLVVAYIAFFALAVSQGGM